MTASCKRHALDAKLVEHADQNHAHLHAHAGQGDEADAGRDRQMRVREVEQRDAADEHERDVDENQQGIAKPLEGEEEQSQHEQQRGGDDDLAGGRWRAAGFRTGLPR